MAWLNKWRWPLLLLLLALIIYETAWLAFLSAGEADLAHYECYGLTFWLGSHGASLLPQTSCSFLWQTTPQPQPPLHMLPQEYPPLTILLFSLPLLAPLPYYSFVFALLMTLSAALVYWLLARTDARRAAPIFLLYLLLGAIGIFQERFDLLPAACTLICLLAGERGRWRLAYLALALGVLLKLYPIVLLPALFLAEQRAALAQPVRRFERNAESKKRKKTLQALELVQPKHQLEREVEFPKRAAYAGLDRERSDQWESSPHSELAISPTQPGERNRSKEHAERASWPVWIWENITRWEWRNSLLCLSLLLSVTGAFALINFNDAILSPLTYFLNRPPQIESLVGSVIWLCGHFGAPATIDFTFGSLNITSSLTHLLSPAATLLILAGLLSIFWLQWRKRIDLAQTLTGLICVLIVTGKVFSPQYLIWLIPLLACIAARGQTNRLWMAAWAIISLLTTFIYIFYYSRMPDPQTARTIVLTLPGFFQLVALRNLLLVFTVLAFICGWWGTRRPMRNMSRP